MLPSLPSHFAIQKSFVQALAELQQGRSLQWHPLRVCCSAGAALWPHPVELRAQEVSPFLSSDQTTASFKGIAEWHVAFRKMYGQA